MTRPKGKGVARGRGGFRRGFAAVAAWLVGAAAGLAGPEALTQAEREWLKDHEPIRFVSQTTYPPFEFVDDVGYRQGLCIELARWMAREFGFQAEFADLPFQAAQDAVLEGRADVLTSLFYSRERDRRFDFTETTWEVPALIFVRAERPDIVRLADLAGKRIAMQAGDFAEEFLRSRKIEYQMISVDSFAEAVDRVVAGSADALIGDRPIVLHHLYSHGLMGQMKSVGGPLYEGRNAMAVGEGQKELASILGKGLELARKRGPFDAITAKWMGTPYGSEPFWKLRHTLAMAVVLVAAVSIAVLLLGWAFHLRRVVAKRTAELREARDPRKPIAPARTWRELLWRSLLLLAFLVPLGLAANRILTHYVVMPDYLALEQKEAQKKLKNAMDAMQREARHLGKLAGDWACWDDTYEFVQSRSQAYIDSNLTLPNLSKQSQIDAILIFDREGKLAWHGAYDPFGERAMEIDDIARHSLLEFHPLLEHPEPTEPRSGILLTEIGPMLFATCAILPSRLTGDSRGTLVMGRFLREEMLEDLSVQLDARLRLANPRSSNLTKPETEIFDRLAPGTYEIQTIDPDTLAGYAMMADLEGRPALLIVLRIAREIVWQGRAAARLLTFLLFEFLLVVFVGTAMWFTISFRETVRRQAHVEALVDARTTALQQSEEKFHILFRQSPIPLALSSCADGRIVDANETFLAQTGFSRAETIGKTTLELGLWADPRQREACMDELKKRGRIGAQSVGIRAKSGEIHDVLWSAEIIQMNGFQYVLASAMDVTEQRRAAAEKEALETQLIQAQKMEAVGRLAGGVAHDFNNMLAVILGNVEMALDSVASDQPLHAELREIHKAAERSADLTRQLLAFARKQTVAPKVLDMNETVEGMLKMLRRLIGEHIELAFQPGEDAGRVKMDPSQIDQILVNLCVNARDAIGDGGTLTIRTADVVVDEAACAGQEGAVPGRYVRLEVRDNGCGMDSETLAHLFEPFYTTKGIGQGTGLGLCTVYGIVKQNNGFIGVESAVGQGTVFSLYMPRFAAEESAGAAPPVQDASVPGHETILLVEDEPSILSMVRSLLERRGYTVLAVGSPGEALRLVQGLRGKIDLLVTDVVMPEMNGRELARTLRLVQPEMKRLYMSGYAADLLAQRGILEDSLNFIHKPFTVAEFEKRVREALAGKSSPGGEA